MRVRVDQERCFICGLCEDICPGLFQVRRWEVRASFEKVPGSLEALCYDAAVQCPRGAIWLAEVPRQAAIEA